MLGRHGTMIVHNQYHTCTGEVSAFGLHNLFGAAIKAEAKREHYCKVTTFRQRITRRMKMIALLILLAMQLPLQVLLLWRHSLLN